MKNLMLYAMFFLTATFTFAVEGDGGMKGYVVNKGEFNCSKYGPDSLKAIENFSLYREYFKQENFVEAWKYWPYVYENAPALQSYVLRDGLTYYKNLVETTEPGPERDGYLEMVAKLYDHRIACFGDEINLLARKGNDLQKYDPDNVDLIRATYKTVIDKGGKKAPYYVLKPYFQILLNDLDDEKVSPEFVLELKDKIQDIIDRNIDDPKNGEKYQKVMDDIDAIFSSNKKVQSLFNCEVMKPTWLEQYNANPNDLAFVKTAYNNMRNGCKDDPWTNELFMKLIELEPSASRMRYMAAQEMKTKNYDGAIHFLKQAIGLEDDLELVAEDQYKIAEMHYVMKDYPTARTWARKAIDSQSGWGKPYLLIGKLYASSGKLCGPGTGLESQRVIWPALDYFNRAKSIDPDSAEEAQELINKYWSYLPEKADIFMQWNKGNGDAYFVPCWIQENTTIRTK